MSKTPAQIAADKVAIDSALQELLTAARQKVKLPAPNHSPDVGPFAHLRAAMKVLKREPLLKRFDAFADSWLDLILREQQELPRPFPRTLADIVTEAGKKASAQRALLSNKGVAVLLNMKEESLVLAPVGPNANVYAVDTKGVTQLGASVADFTQREVARLLGTPKPALVAPVADKTAAREASKLDRALAKLRKAQPPSSTVHGALVAAWSIHDVASNEDLLALDAFAQEHELSLFAGCGDVESTATDSPLWLGHWLVGIELAAVRGATDKRSGFTFDAAALADATKRLDTVAAPLRALCKGRASKPEKGIYVVARGGLPVVQLVKGTWVDPPAATKRDPAALEAWLSALPVSDEGVGHVHGTRGATQSRAPGAVRGVKVGGADACAEAVAWTAKQDKDLDRTLAKAGITDARYFLVTRFD